MKTLLFATVLLIAGASLTGCDSIPTLDENVKVASTRQKDSPAPYPVADADRTQAVAELVEFRQKMLLLEGKLIAPAIEDLAEFADLTSDPNAGLARVFPGNPGNQMRPLLVRGGGAYYQFKGRTNEYGYGADLEYSTFSSPQFSVGFAGVDFGFYAQLGKMDIRQIDAQNSVVEFALSYLSPSGQNEPAWRIEQRKWATGITSNGVTFKDRTEAVVGMSYVVRSVSENGYDVVVVFQVVRRDPTDGSLILAWKIVKEFDKPVMKRN